MPRSISNRASMRCTASSAIGEMTGSVRPWARRRAPAATSASTKNLRRAWAQQAASRIGLQSACRSLSKRSPVQHQSIKHIAPSSGIYTSATSGTTMQLLIVSSRAAITMLRSPQLSAKPTLPGRSLSLNSSLPPTNSPCRLGNDRPCIAPSKSRMLQKAKLQLLAWPSYWQKTPLSPCQAPSSQVAGMPHR
jgi:hypothetical protein